MSNHPLWTWWYYFNLFFRYTLPGIEISGKRSLLNLKNLNNIFLPVNKHGAQAKDAVSALEDAYASDCQMIMFPAGLVSRKQQGIIQDLEWQKVSYPKPSSIDGILSRSLSMEEIRTFLQPGEFPEKIGLKANIEMLYLPDETFKQRNRTFTLYIGQPIEWESLDKSKTDRMGSGNQT